MKVPTKALLIMYITWMKRATPPKKTVAAIDEIIVNSRSIKQIPMPSCDFRLKLLIMIPLSHLAAQYKMHKYKHAFFIGVGYKSAITNMKSMKSSIRTATRVE